MQIASPAYHTVYRSTLRLLAWPRDVLKNQPLLWTGQTIDGVDAIKQRPFLQPRSVATTGHRTSFVMCPWTSRSTTSLTVVRDGGDPRKSFDALRDIGRRVMPSAVWDKVRAPDVDSDVWLATAWISESVGDYAPTGVYFGLDTLNEHQGEGSNVEIGMTRAADPGVLELDWAYSLERYGERHLIDGAYKANRACRKAGLEGTGRELAEYLFFFGYSGVVLAAAVERIGVDSDCLYIWGFHDGDLGFLARASPSGVTRLAAVEGT